MVEHKMEGIRDVWLDTLLVLLPVEEKAPRLNGRGIARDRRQRPAQRLAQMSLTRRLTIF